MTAASQIEKLKVCPFCGGEARHNERWSGMARLPFVECSVCEARTDTALQWNTRATPEPTPLTDAEWHEAVELMDMAIHETYIAKREKPHDSLLLNGRQCAGAALNALLEHFSISRRKP